MTSSTRSMASRRRMSSCSASVRSIRKNLLPRGKRFGSTQRSAPLRSGARYAPRLRKVAVVIRKALGGESHVAAEDRVAAYRVSNVRPGPERRRLGGRPGSVAQKIQLNSLLSNESYQSRDGSTV